MEKIKNSVALNSVKEGIKGMIIGSAISYGLRSVGLIGEKGSKIITTGIAVTGTLFNGVIGIVGNTINGMLEEYKKNLKKWLNVLI